MKKILCLGNALVDILTTISNDTSLSALGLQKGGMTLIAEERYREIHAAMADMTTSVATGGSAGNTALCIAHLGGKVGYVCKMNTETKYGTYFSDTFRQSGADIRIVPSSAQMSPGVCCAFVSPDNERTFATCLGTSDLLADNLTADMFTGADIVHIEGYLVVHHALLLRAIELAHAAGALVSLDLASYNIVREDHAFFAEHLSDIDLVFANEEEAAAWHPGTPEESLAALAAVCRTAVVKVGARGAWYQHGSERVFGPAERVVDVKDTTAAGDFFAAGFLYALAQEKSPVECLHAGAYCASRVIQVMGTALTPAMWTDVRSHIG